MLATPYPCALSRSSVAPLIWSAFMLFQSNSLRTIPSLPELPVGGRHRFVSMTVISTGFSKPRSLMDAICRHASSSPAALYASDRAPVSLSVSTGSASMGSMLASRRWNDAVRVESPTPFVLLENATVAVWVPVGRFNDPRSLIATLTVALSPPRSEPELGLTVSQFLSEDASHLIASPLGTRFVSV